MPSPRKAARTETEAVELARTASGADDPCEGLHAIAVLRRGLELLEAQHVDAAVAAGRSWREVAEAIGVSRQAAHRKHAARVLREAERRAEGSAAGRRVTIVGAARQAVLLARREAATVASPVVGTEHLLIGLAQRRGAAAEVLTTLGVSAEKLRRCAQSLRDIAHGEPETEDHVPVSTEAAQRLPFSRRGREALEQALREAVARGDGHLGEEHLLLALLRDPGSRAVSCLTRLRVTPPMVVDAIAAVLAGEAALSGGRRPSRRAAATPRPAR